MSQSWIVNVGGRTYGPYTVAQMRAFAAEGRLAPFSLVAKSGQDGFCAASEDPNLAPIFASRASSDAPGPSPAAENGTPVRVFGARKANNAVSHFVIVAEMKSGSIGALEEQIFSLGHAVAIAPQAWILCTDQAIVTIRNELVQKLGKLDQLFVADATHDKIAWTNYPPESEIRLRRVWTKAPPQSAFG